MKHILFSVTTAALLALTSATLAGMPLGYIVFHNTQDPNYAQLCINMSPIGGNNKGDNNVHGCIGAKSSSPKLPYTQSTYILPLMVFFRTADYGAHLISNWPIACTQIHAPQVITVTVTDAKGDYQISCPID